MDRSLGNTFAKGLAVAGALGLFGCRGLRSPMTQDAKDKLILELGGDKLRLEKDLAASQAQVEALRAQLAQPPAAAPPPAAVPAPPAAPAPHIELTAALKKKGVKVVTREGVEHCIVPGALLFASGKTSLSRDAKTTLKQVADVLNKAAPTAHIRVEGHTDSDPIRKTKNLYKSNQELSEARAKAVRDFLVEDGKMEAGRLEVVGRGESQPIASNKTSAGKRENRRVELVIQGGGNE